MTVCHKPSITQNKSEDFTQAGTCVGRCRLHYAMQWARLEGRKEVSLSKF